MIHQRHYLCEFHLDGRQFYVVWYSNDKNGLVLFENKKIASFPDETDARVFCRSKGISLMPEQSEAYDFDALDAWCQRPTTESVDPVKFLDAWNMLEDAL